MTTARSRKLARPAVSATSAPMPARRTNMRTLALLVGVPLVTSITAAGCSWGRFDDVSTPPAIEILHAGSSFGNVIATAPSLSTTNDAVLVSFGAREPTFAKWSLADIENPGENGTSGSFLPIANSVGVSATLSARSLAFLGRLSPNGKLDQATNQRCWVHGFRAKGTIGASGSPSAGLAITCFTPSEGANVEQTIGRLPSDVNPTPGANAQPNDGFSASSTSFETEHEQDAVTATVLGAAANNEGRQYLFPDVVKFDGWGDGAFAMGVPDIKKAFVYFRVNDAGVDPADPTFTGGADWDVFPLAITAFDSDPASADLSFGASLAVLPAAVGTGTRGLAVAEPTTGRVYLYDVDMTAHTTTPRGCIKGNALEGLTLHGYADGGKRLLASSDAAGTVHVYDFDAITSDACVEVAPAATLTCANNGDVEGCDQGVFGAAITHGDLDGDGDQELLVGAPGMNAREKVNAGAVYVYDLDNFSPAQTDVLFLGFPKNQSRMGTSVSVVRAGNHDVPLAGAPGSNDVMVFYCNALSKSSPRCQ